MFLADRVVILGSNPGRIRGEVRIDLPRPHERTDPRFKSLVDYIYEIMTNPEIAVTGEVALPALAGDKTTSPYALPLPHARVGGISGLLELIVEWPQGRVEIAELAERLQLAVDDLLPILDAAVLLGFAEVTGRVVQLTEIGQDFANTTILRSKDLFRQQLLARVPVFKSILQTLEEKNSRSMRADFFLDLWDEHFPHEEAERQFATAVDWGRYAELFEYDASEERLYLPDPSESSAASEPVGLDSRSG